MPQTTWIDDVRGVLKREHGKGWSVEQQSGKIKLVRRVPGQSSKQAITTQLPWRASSQTKLLSLVVELRQKMEDLGLSMADAHKLMVVTPEAVPVSWIGKRSPGGTNNNASSRVLNQPSTERSATKSPRRWLC